MSVRLQIRRHVVALTEQTAAHESPKATKLYDRTCDQITLDAVERIRDLRFQSVAV
jgi:hypothetical protein